MPSDFTEIILLQ